MRTFSDELEQYEYFKYTNLNQLIFVKNEIDKVFNKLQILSSPKTKDFLPLDLRLYFCDMVVLCEPMGYAKYIEQIKPTLQLLNVYEDAIRLLPQSTETEINVDSVYIFFKSLNEITKLKGIDETWFLIYGGNDGQALLLNKDLFKFLSHFIKDAKSKPVNIETWRELMIWGYAPKPDINLQSKIPSPGDKIDHNSLGLGIIKTVSDRGVAVIDFELHGDRNVILQYAKYKFIN